MLLSRNESKPGNKSRKTIEYYPSNLTIIAVIGGMATTVSSLAEGWQQSLDCNEHNFRSVLFRGCSNFGISSRNQIHQPFQGRFWAAESRNA
jgi:hypothetical protein